MIPIDLRDRVPDCNAWLKIYTVRMDYGVYARLQAYLVESWLDLLLPRSVAPLNAK